MSEKWTVKIIQYDTGEVVKAMKAESERMAERIEDGVSINLNHAKFFVVIEPPSSTCESA